MRLFSNIFNHCAKGDQAASLLIKRNVSFGQSLSAPAVFSTHFSQLLSKVFKNKFLLCVQKKQVFLLTLYCLCGDILAFFSFFFLWIMSVAINKNLEDILYPPIEQCWKTGMLKVNIISNGKIQSSTIISLGVWHSHRLLGNQWQSKWNANFCRSWRTRLRLLPCQSSLLRSASLPNHPNGPTWLRQISTPCGTFGKQHLGFGRRHGNIEKVSENWFLVHFWWLLGFNSGFSLCHPSSSPSQSFDSQRHFSLYSIGNFMVQSTGGCSTNLSGKLSKIQTLYPRRRAGRFVESLLHQVDLG